ncbi:MAG: hypothetical protein J5694_06840 [Erysipelotrichaceae bacterium]|nr:hypothetical protein [Erysipelotrichaceae bacterium]
MYNNEPEMERMPEEKTEQGRPFAEPLMTDDLNRLVLQDFSGTYRWIYELPMKHAFFLLAEVWKVLATSVLVVAGFFSMISYLTGKSLIEALGTLSVTAVVFAILIVLSIPAYYIVTKANNGMYTVLFEMDHDGIDHVQIKTEKARALEKLTIFVGLAAKSRTGTAAGLLNAAGGSLYTKFNTAKRIGLYPGKHLITLKGGMLRNQVYADDEAFDFISNYIISHCPKARVRRSR